MSIFDSVQYMGNSSGTKRVVILVTTIAAFLLAATILYLLYNQQRTIDDLSARNAALSSEVRSLSQQIEASSTAGPTNGQPTDRTSYTSKKGVKLTVTQPPRDAEIASPLTVAGSAPGSWSFEAQFVTKLLDGQGNTLAESPATMQGDWMTDQPVPFTATLTFVAPESPQGTLLLEKSNPSGLPEHSDSVSVPVKF